MFPAPQRPSSRPRGNGADVRAAVGASSKQMSPVRLHVAIGAATATTAVADRIADVRALVSPSSPSSPSSSMAASIGFGAGPEPSSWPRRRDRARPAVVTGTRLPSEPPRLA
jgi:hypothetical protein